jgi:hypothetical protein
MSASPPTRLRPGAKTGATGAEAKAGRYVARPPGFAVMDGRSSLGRSLMFPNVNVLWLPLQEPVV